MFSKIVCEYLETLPIQILFEIDRVFENSQNDWNRINFVYNLFQELPTPTSVMKNLKIQRLRTLIDTAMHQIQFQCENLSQDGRANSAMGETKYLQLLEGVISQIDPTISFYNPPIRYWYDVMIDDIPINVKITSGGTDNAFNKTAIIYSITGKTPVSKKGHFNEFNSHIRRENWKSERDPSTEYHYLVIYKNKCQYLFKSILDISEYKSNPSNILQINWNREYKNRNYSESDHHGKIGSLLRTIQKSVIQQAESSSDFRSSQF